MFACFPVAYYKAEADPDMLPRTICNGTGKGSDNCRCDIETHGKDTKMMTELYKRKLGGIERMRVNFPNISVVMCARIHGNVTARDVRLAVCRVRRRHPLLGARIEFDADGYGYFRTHNVPDNSVAVRPVHSETAWMEVVRDELKKRWNVLQGPLARFTLLHSPAASDLVVCAHHSICDGRSLAYLLSDILGLIADPDQEVSRADPVPLDEAVPGKARGGALYRWMVNRMNAKWLEKGHSFKDHDFQELHESYWQERDPAVFFWSLSEGLTGRIVSAARERNASVNSVLYAAVLTAQNRLLDTSPDYFKTVMVPVDFRDYLDVDVSRALGFYASAVRLTYKLDPSKLFWDTVEELDRRAERKLTDKEIFGSQKTSLITPRFLDGICLAMFGDFEDEMAVKMASRMEEKVRTGVLLSNLGRVDVPDAYGHMRLEWLSPPAVYSENSRLAVEVLTFNGRMHFTATTREMPATAEFVEDFRQELRWILEDHTAH